MDNTYSFDCGCTFEVTGPTPVPGALPLLKLDPYRISPVCSKTWAMLARGHTKGVFQLESPLGRQWCKTLKPEELDHMSALGALLRPGCLKAEIEPGVSMTKLFCLRKNGERPVEKIHPVLDEILRPTMGVLVYQEQSMRIGKDLAGFDLKNVDRLRKAIGKKDQKEMEAVGTLFLDGVKERQIVPIELGHLVWSWIQKSGRYQFNKSHSLSYGVIGYITAYLKAHFPLYFFTSWLHYARAKADSQDEVRELVDDARGFDIRVTPPKFTMLEPYTQTDFQSVVLGLSDIMGVGDAVVTKIIEQVRVTEVELNKGVAHWSWYEFLIWFSHKIPHNVVDKMIRVGALSHFRVPRTRLKMEFDTWASLTEKEQGWVRTRSEHWTTLVDALDKLALPKLKRGEPGDPGGCANKNRRQTVLGHIALLRNPASSTSDSPYWLVCQEEGLLGISLSISRSEANVDASQITSSCREVLAGHNGRDGLVMLGVEVVSAREVSCKKGKSSGKKMSFLTVADATGSLSDIVCFPESWQEFKGLLTEGNCVYLHGERDKSRDSLIVKGVWQA